jgi:hypothetical protein
MLSGQKNVITAFNLCWLRTMLSTIILSSYMYLALNAGSLL